ncbi:MAG: hypothetical protein IKN04_22300 [Clostridia bacterium]|nr:hypothetical protein [Clostridia bacterium]MBR6185469.1 hypothetical protein [Clostridia bacterium]
MSKMLELERMGYRFRLEGNRVLAECFGTPPAEAAALLAGLDREEVKLLLDARAAGFSVAPDGVLWVAGADDILQAGRELKAALDAGELFSVNVIYHKKTGIAEFRFRPAGWLQHQ